MADSPSGAAFDARLENRYKALTEIIFGCELRRRSLIRAFDWETHEPEDRTDRLPYLALPMSLGFAVRLSRTCRPIGLP